MSNEMQQYTPFDGYGSDMVEYTPNAALARPTNGPADLPVQGGMVKKIHHSLRGRYLIRPKEPANIGNSPTYANHPDRR